MDINECFDMTLVPEELRKRESSLDTQVCVAAYLFLSHGQPTDLFLRPLLNILNILLKILC